MEFAVLTQVRALSERAAATPVERDHYAEALECCLHRGEELNDEIRVLGLLDELRRVGNRQQATIGERTYLARALYNRHHHLGNTPAGEAILAEIDALAGDVGNDGPIQDELLLAMGNTHYEAWMADDSELVACARSRIAEHLRRPSATSDHQLQMAKVLLREAESSSLSMKFALDHEEPPGRFSFVFALEALARCHLREKHTSVFVSYNLEDAKEKILTARQVHEELPLAYPKRLVVDSNTDLSFESNGSHKRLSRTLSNPSKAPRGKRGDVYLDELAHYVTDREVYRSSTALILRGNGQLTGCSTPLGRRGIFWEIATEEIRKYPHHRRQDVPWWLSRFFCVDPKRAAIEALSMPTEERVATFGKITLQRREVVLPRDREVVAQVHSIKKRVLPSGKVAFDAERTTRGGHADRLWAMALACQRERVVGRGGVGVEVGVRVIG